MGLQWNDTVRYLRTYCIIFDSYYKSAQEKWFLKVESCVVPVKHSLPVNNSIRI